jgi:hypothetical protein
MAAHREALRCAASASSLPFAAVNDDVPAALLRAATAGLMQRSDAPYDVSFSSADVELSMQLHLLDEAEGGARVLYGTVQNAASLPDGLEEEMLRDLRADAAVHDAQMTPFTLFRSTQARAGRREQGPGCPSRRAVFRRAPLQNVPRGKPRA